MHHPIRLGVGCTKHSDVPPFGMGGRSFGMGEGEMDKVLRCTTTPRWVGGWTRYSDVPPLRDGWGHGQGSQMNHPFGMGGGWTRHSHV